VSTKSRRAVRGDSDQALAARLLPLRLYLTGFGTHAQPESFKSAPISAHAQIKHRQNGPLTADETYVSIRNIKNCLKASWKTSRRRSAAVEVNDLIRNKETETMWQLLVGPDENNYGASESEDRS
jgi:hypothetical protein